MGRNAPRCSRMLSRPEPKRAGFRGTKTRNSDLDARRNGSWAGGSLSDGTDLWIGWLLSPWLGISFLHPFCEFPALLPNVHEIGPAFQHAKRVSHEVLVGRSAVVRETLPAFALDLACPHAPFDRSQRAASQNQPKEYDECRNDCLDYNVRRERNGRR